MEDHIERLIAELYQAGQRRDWISVRLIAEQIRSVDSENEEALAFLRQADQYIAVSEISSDDANTAGQLKLEKTSGVDPDGAPIGEVAIGPDDSTVGALFVGRAREMAQLKAAVEDTIDGNGRVVMLSGEPGIGKTRTAEELSAYAESRGIRVLWGKIHEERGAPVYWPWKRAIRSYVQSTHPEILRAEMGSGAGVIAKLLPEIHDILGDVDSPIALGDSSAEQFRLFDAMSSFLASAAADAPLMLVLDNLQWADETSLRLLEFVSRETDGSRLMIVGTYRDIEMQRTHPLVRILGGLTKERHFRRLALRRLVLEDVEQVVEKAVGITAYGPLVGSLFALTEGNPLFVVETIRFLVEEGKLNADQPPDGASWNVPESVREVIKRRLFRLSDRCNEILVVSSVLGRDFDVHALHLLTDELSEEQLLGALQEAIASRIIEEIPDVIGHYQFSHKIVQEALSEDLSHEERARLHRRIVDVLEQLYGEDADEHAGKLAAHCMQAGDLLGTEKLLHYCLIAGSEATESGAYEQASDYFNWAINAKKDQPMDDDIAEIYRRRGLVLYMLSKIEEAIDTSVKLFGYYEKQQNIERAVEMVECLRWLYVYKRGNSLFPINDYYRRALELAVGALSENAAVAMNAANIRLAFTGDIDGFEEDMAHALAVATRCRDVNLQREIHDQWAKTELHLGRVESGLGHLRRASELAPKVDDFFSRYARYSLMIGALGQIGDPDGANKIFDKYFQIASDLGFNHLAGAYLKKQSMAAREGDWQSAREFNDWAAQTLNRSLRPYPDQFYVLCSRINMEYDLGNFGAGDKYVDLLLRHLHDPQASFFINAILCSSLVFQKMSRILGSQKHLDVAARASKELLAVASARGAKFALSGHENLGMIAVVRGDREKAKKHCDFLNDNVGELRNSYSHSMALIAHTAGYIDAALGHFETAYAFAKKAKNLPDLAWVCCDYADGLLERNTDGDKRNAVILLEEGRALAARLEMKPLQERIASRLETLSSTEKSIYPDGLTSREVEVLQCIAKGMTNQEIGFELSISPRTVTTHVQHIYEKIGTTNRVAAAAFAVDHGLADPLP